MQSERLPFVVKILLLLVIFALGFLLARDLFFIISGPSEQKNSSYAAAQSSPAPTKTKKGITSSETSSSARPVGSKEALLEKADRASNLLGQDLAKDLPADNPSTIGKPMELGNAPSKSNALNAKPLRDTGILPGGDLRTGADAKPLGSLRTPSESSVSGSLRSDELSLPTGSLRQDEGHLPTGSLR
jgi:cytoskeletal protein RodZ